MGASFGLRSSGLLVFVGRLASAFTGLLFTIMAARWLVPRQLGLWEVIIDLVTFSSYPIGTIAFWVTRDVARGRMVGRTALASGALMSGGGLAIYLVFTLFTYSSLATSTLPFFLGILLVPLSYWSGIANSIVQGHRPSIYGYSLIISEVAKVGVAYEALYVYHLGIEGVILGLIASYFVQSVVSTYMVRVTLTEPFSRAQVRRWSRLAWLPALSYLPSVVSIADTYVASLGFGTTIAGLYQPAFTVASVVGYSSAMAFSLYPLLLRGGGERLPAITVEFSLLFSIPMAVGAFILSGPILFLFGPLYLPGAQGLSVLAVAFIVITISGIVDQTLLGTERTDENSKVSFWDLARSNLLFVPVVNVVWACAYIGAMYVVLAYMFAHGFPLSQEVTAWALVQLVAAAAFLVFKARRALRFARLLPGKSTIYYVVAAAVMGIVVYTMSALVVDESLDTIAYGSRLIVIVLVGTAVYFGLVYLLDKEFRRMAWSLLR